MDELDRTYRKIIGEQASDRLIGNGIHLDLLLDDVTLGHLAYGHVGGGDDYGAMREKTLVASGSTATEAAVGLLTTIHPSRRQNSLRSRLWALGEAMELLSGALNRA